MKITYWIAAAALATLTVNGAAAATLYSQGFESDTSGWTNANRVSSGTNGITSASGAYHAEYNGAPTYTTWGGYNSSNGGAGFVPYTTSIDIFLNVSGGWSNDTRFDWDSAISNASGNFLRDFIFNAGFYDSSDVTGPGAGTDRFVISASNNSQPGSAYAKNPGRNPIAIATSGWYTFEHEFFDNSGTLGVNMSIHDNVGTLVAMWALGGDPIGGDPDLSAGGNRYGWFDYNQFSTLAFDNATLTATTSVPLPGGLPLLAAALGSMGFFGWRRRNKGRMAA